jgi:predicted phage replisome organizer
MADVKWIKITTDIFDDEKVLLIESLPDSYAIITCWFKLLCLAGKQNNSGVFLMGRIPYTDKMLATIFRMKETTVTMALKTFEQFGMVELVDGVITIPNWGKHQNLDQIESKNAYMKKYMREYREKQKALAASNGDSKANSKSNSKANVSEAEEEREEEGDKEKETDIRDIVELYNSICISFPSVRSLSNSRRKAIKARLNTYTAEDLKTVFQKAEASEFLKGSNDRNWTATFDWLIKDTNIAKVLDGNYDNKPRKTSGRKEVIPAWMNKPEDNVQTEEETLDTLQAYVEINPALKERVEEIKRRIAERHGG